MFLKLGFASSVLSQHCTALHGTEICFNLPNCTVFNRTSVAWAVVHYVFNLLTMVFLENLCNALLTKQLERGIYIFYRMFLTTRKS